MTNVNSSIRSAVLDALPRATEFLKSLIAIPSPSGQESAAMEFAATAFAQFAKVSRVKLDNSLRKDPLYCDVLEDLDYTNRFNFTATLKGDGSALPLLLNTHMDTVPPSQGQPSPFEPRVQNGAILGRGACDAKGQVATIHLAMLALASMGVKLPADLVAHVVVEEEVGGNGTLAMARTNPDAAACIVLEPTGNAVLPSIRGAVWFRLSFRGCAGHSGSAPRRSALKMAIKAMEILERYHADLLAASKGIALFDKYDNPMPLTIGKLSAGNWPATNPSLAILEGVLGLLPNKTARQVIAEIEQRLVDTGGRELADNVTLHFPYRHDSSVCPADADIVGTLMSGLRNAGAEARIDAMPASCDACFYSAIGIPTVVFGPGLLSFAHSADEQINIDDLAVAAQAIAAAAIGAKS